MSTVCLESIEHFEHIVRIHGCEQDGHNEGRGVCESSERIQLIELCECYCTKLTSVLLLFMLIVTYHLNNTMRVMRKLSLHVYKNDSEAECIHTFNRKSVTIPSMPPSSALSSCITSTCRMRSVLLHARRHRSLMINLSIQL